MRHQLLLVDDEPRNLLALEAALETQGYRIVKAQSGPEALDILGVVAPDLVLLDISMPGMDGVEVLERIRARKELAALPVIMVTAHAEREHRLRSFEAGADEFIEKPIDLPILMARLRTLLGLKESRDALSESRKTLADRNQALELLQREQRELNEFLVHDLKNPLTVVSTSLAYAAANVRTAAPERMEKVLVEGHEAAHRLTLMVQDLLTVSRLEHREFPIRLESVHVCDLLSNIVAGYNRLAEAIDVQISIAPSDASLRVRADPGLLQRVVENIIDNSLRYTPTSGRIALSAEGNGAVTIAISNNGPPVPLKYRQRIFEKFARLDAHVRDHSHAGLGLYFCKRAVEAHGGTIGVIETEEWPTRFLISLPSAIEARC
jgi:two-component system sensor histidine kinase/response regulator